MTTEKQLAANRLNALKSTGPRTARGKAIARLNAVRDGLTGQLTIVPREEYATWVGFSQRLTASLDPMGDQELHVAARIVRDTWRLHRIAANEENLYTLGYVENASDTVFTESGAEADPAFAVAICHARTFFDRTRDFTRASLYEQRLSRGLSRDYALFRQLQRDRNLPESRFAPRSRHLQPNPPAPIDDPDRHANCTINTPNGFVCKHYPKYLWDIVMNMKIAPQVVNSEHPYVSPWPKRFQTHPYEVDCDW